MGDKKYHGYHGSSGYRRAESRPDGLFGWTIFIFLLIGLVFLCWMGSYYIFARPEKAANYRLLQRLHKLEPPQRFAITEAPRGEFLKPSQLLERFGAMTASEIRRANETLLRAFILNYHQSRDLVPYAVGSYRVIGTFSLSEKTFCASGVVAILQAIEQPEIVLEQLFTANEKNLLELKRSLTVGQEIKLEKPLDLSAIIHIDRLAANRIKLTTMPLLYGSYGSGQGAASFSLEPPVVLNLDAGLPAIQDSEIDQLSSEMNTPSKENQKGLHLTRINEEQPTPTPTATPTPETQVARAIPVNTQPILPAIPLSSPVSTPIAIPTPEATPMPEAMPNQTPIQTPTPTPTPVATVSQPKILTNGVASTAAVSTPSGPWPVYEPGKMPRGELLSASESVELAAHNGGHERHYLQGRFSVTASGNGRVVLRPQSAMAGLPIGASSKIRVIVEFPNGASIPSEGHSISRDGLRPFQIISVKRGEDGVVNVYAREVTKGE